MTDVTRVTDEPAAVRAERAVLGSILLKPDVMDDVLATGLRAEDFSDDAHGCVYGHMEQIREDGNGLDELTLVARLKASGDLHKAGGESTIIKFARSVPNAFHAVHYAETVRERAIQRHLLSAGLELVSRARHLERPDEIIASLDRRLASIAETETAGHPDPPELIRKTIEGIDARRKEGVVSSIPTGFHDLDDLTGGMRPGELIVLAARTSIGKTALAINIADNAAMASNPVLFVSLEQSATEITERRLCRYCGLDGQRLRLGEISDEAWIELSEGGSRLAELPLFVASMARVGASRIRSLARFHRRRHGIALLIVDYLQFVEPEDRRVSREQQVSATTQSMKTLAMTLEIPVLCLAQLNRDAETDKPPTLAHLRESGVIEQNADQVWMIHRNRQAEGVTQAQILVLKNRNGKTGSVDVLWQPSHLRFDDLAPELLGLDY